ncbi:MAG: N-acetylmuramoyl-L-alanine amidase [Firmicutes bacterium]|nr:N-acetylmuramoyl-L-alanine amidase [Bacillota bacterium]
MAQEAAGQIDKVYLHWSAGHYGQPFADYHVNIDRDGKLYTAVESLAELLPHTWRRNTGSVGVAILCCAKATTEDLGKEPPTEVQLTALAKVIAVICQEAGIPLDYDHVRTHAEQADEDGYGPQTTCERWDLWFLRQGEDPGSGGEELRAAANAMCA